MLAQARRGPALSKRAARAAAHQSQRSEATAHSCSRPRPTVEPEYGDVWFAMKAGATLAAIADACSRVGGERSVGCAFGWDWRVVEPPRAGVGRVSSDGALTPAEPRVPLELWSGFCSTCPVARPRRR
jgi:hypothetical protein